MPLFPELRAKLLTYKSASTEERQKLLTTTIQSIQALKPVTTTALALEAYETMAFAATMINYADALHRIENQGYFDILIDFKMPDLFQEPQFRPLNNYFEFHSKAPQMQLKKPIEIIPTEIWALFREAQQEQLHRRGKEHNFNLAELDITRPPKNQLYPLPIQMMGRLVNEAVDRVCSNSQGKYRFAHRYGSYLLPGGGMVEISMERSQDKLMRKMLDEHLEEEHGNLAIKAAAYFNEIDKDLFIKAMRERIAKEKIIETLGNTQLRDDLEKTLESDQSNADILLMAIHFIDLANIDPLKVAAQTKLLRELRAGLQVETFKHHALYEAAFAFIMENTTVLDIEQFGDVRACGGQQISHSFLMRRPLEHWFAAQLGDDSIAMADDLTGSDIIHLSLLEALTNFSQVKFSHILIVLAHQTTVLKDKTLQLADVWDSSQYEAAKTALIKGGVEHLKKTSHKLEATGALGLFVIKNNPGQREGASLPSYAP